MDTLAAPTDVSASARGCGPFSPAPGTNDSLRLSIFERIRAEGSVARAKIAKDLAISPATVTTQTSALIEMGFVREERIEAETAEIARGRPPIALAVQPDIHIVAGLKLSDAEHSAVLYDFSGRQLASATLPAAEHEGTAKVIDATVALVDAVCAAGNVPLRDLSAIGVGLPGFVDGASGMVHWSPLLDAGSVNLAEQLTQRIGQSVVVENDANVVALAELWFGVGRQISDFAVVTIEHGVGMGLVINHKLYTGARGMGMELGHTKVALDGALCRCGQRGCLEAYVADYALVREAALASRNVDSTAPMQTILESLHAEAKAGNDTARSIFERAGKYLAMGMANVVNLFDPQLIILSGERMQYDYLYSDDILEELARRSLRTEIGLPPVEVHAWGDQVWASGAAAMALAYVTETALKERQTA